jgi:hypothetical protein
LIPSFSTLWARCRQQRVGYAPHGLAIGFASVRGASMAWQPLRIFLIKFQLINLVAEDGIEPPTYGL